MERSYVEIKVSFLHIVVLLVGVILIGSFLFYLGYQAGKSSVKNQMQPHLTKGEDNAEEIQLVDDKDKGKKRKGSSINEEIKLHQTPPKQREKIKAKSIEKEPYYSIQVGAFSDYENAKNYSVKFAKMGYPTEILTTVRKNKKFFRVRVGNFKTKAEAMQEKTKLEKKENAKSKFQIKKSG